MAFLRQPPAYNRHAPQSAPYDKRQVPNNAGGYAYEVDKWDALDRFLILGTQGGTYYVGQEALTDAAAANVGACLNEDAKRTIARVVEISDAGRAIKQDYGIYVLAIAASYDVNSEYGLSVRHEAYVALPQVCRTASTLFQFLSYTKGRRGWSRGLRSAIARVHNGWDEQEKLAYQFVKYQQRDGFSQRDVLRLAHVKPQRAEQNELYRWAVGKPPTEGAVAPPSLVSMFETAHSVIELEPDRKYELARILPREALPTAWLKDPNVWDGLLTGGQGMPITAMVRNLGNMSKCGLLVAKSNAAAYVVQMLSNEAKVRASRIHPIALMLAASQYASGAGMRGSGSWAPVGAVVDALEVAFELALKNVEPTGKKRLIAVDSSGSMASVVAGTSISARNASLAMAWVIMRTEPNARLIGFTDSQAGQFELKVGGDERLRDLLQRFEHKIVGHGTDLAIPAQWAKAYFEDADTIECWTDSETWAGHQHAAEALRLMRAHGHRVKMVVAATTATGVTVGDPQDRHTLQCVGFDASIPQVIAEFIAS